MIEIIVTAAIIGLVWWKWDVISAWVGAAAKDVADDDME